MKPHFSRRDFLKLVLAGIGGWLVSCLPRRRDEPLPPSATPSATDALPPTATPSPTSSPTATPTATPSATPTPTPVPCFRLLAPQDGTSLPALGRVTFAWEAMPGAARYELRFTLPSGQTVSFQTENTAYTRYIESFAAAGTYSWQALAYDASGALLCAAEPFTFTKPVSPLPTATKQKGGQDGDNGGSDGGPSGGDGDGGPGDG